MHLILYKLPYFIKRYHSVIILLKLNDSIMTLIVLVQHRVSSLLYAVERKKSVTLLFGEKALIPLSQSIPCANTFSRETPANVRSKAMNVTREDKADEASRPIDMISRSTNLTNFDYRI